MRRLLVLFAALATACGGASGDDGGESAATLPEEAFAIVASSDLAVGEERLLVGIAGPNNQRLGGPDTPVTLEVVPFETPGEPIRVQGTWIWAIPDHSGLYRAVVTFEAAGTYAVRLVVGDRTLPEVPFLVQPEPATVAVGEMAPASTTPTAADVEGLAAITTDPDPDAGLYDLSVHEAIASGRPSVIVFATPAFCTSAVCGPTLDEVKALAPAHPDVNFVHVEVYEGLLEPGFAPTPDRLSPAVIEWGLPTEPWIFVVDADGIVTARFEGVVAPEELEAALS